MLKKVSMMAFLLVGVATAGTARAAETSLSGVVCQPMKGDAVDYGQYGVHNPSAFGSPDVTVECSLPLGLATGPRVTGVVVTTYDRNTSSNVSCLLTELDLSGGVMWSTTLATSGSASGPQTLTFSPPAASQANHAWRLRCTIPALASSGLASHVTTIKVTVP
jgi:hypothetical protein